MTIEASNYVAVMKQALEALERCGSESYMLEREAITALRLAIARAEGTSEAEDPDKATTKLLDGGKWKTRNQFNPDWDVVATMSEEVQRLAKRVEELEAEKAKKQEPVAWLQDSIEFYAKEYRDHVHTIPLYTSPPTQCRHCSQRPVPQEHKPLTDEQIGEIGRKHEKFANNGNEWFDRWTFARAIEAAHGITKEQP